MEYLRELRKNKVEQLQDFKEVYPEDERGLKYMTGICGQRCINFERENLSKEEKECLQNCVWKFGQVLSRDEF